MTVLQRVTQFGSGAQVYVFPNTLQSFDPNFNTLSIQTTELPGADGGFDNFGLGLSPAKPGKLKLSFFLVADTPEEMTGLRDAVKALRGYGRKQLFMQPTDNTDPVRWCWARVERVDLAEDLTRSIRDLHQPVTIHFHVPDPMWVSQGTEAALWGSFVWGDGTVWGGSAPAWAVSGVLNDYTITPVGSAIVQPRIKMSCGAGQLAFNPKFQRIVNGAVVDEVAYNGYLTAGDSMEINCRAMSFKINNTDAYTGDEFDFLDPHWMRLLPGANTFRILMDNASDAATVRVLYFEGYY